MKAIKGAYNNKIPKFGVFNNWSSYNNNNNNNNQVLFLTIGKTYCETNKGASQVSQGKSAKQHAHCPIVTEISTQISFSIRVRKLTGESKNRLVRQIGCFHFRLNLVS